MWHCNCLSIIFLSTYLSNLSTYPSLHLPYIRRDLPLPPKSKRDTMKDAMKSSTHILKPFSKVSFLEFHSIIVKAMNFFLRQHTTPPSWEKILCCQSQTRFSPWQATATMQGQTNNCKSHSLKILKIESSKLDILEKNLTTFKKNGFEGGFLFE